jgi:NAD(P)-dependent dehydrogenase (short-subunit alcohol dehydrogenase family)
LSAALVHEAPYGIGLDGLEPAILNAGALGQSIAARLRSEAETVLLVDVDEERLAPVAGALGAAYVVADLAAAEAPKAVCTALEQRGWIPRILVNNAGINRDARVPDMTDENFAAVLRVELGAPARLAVAMHEAMSAGGSIANIASRAALGSFGQTNYAAAKAGLIGLTRALAIEWATRARRHPDDRWHAREGPVTAR